MLELDKTIWLGKVMKIRKTLIIGSSYDFLFRTLKEKKIRCLTDSTKIGAHGKPVMFLHPKDCGGVLVELEQA